MLWETPVTSFARGVLTQNAIFIPGEDAVIELDPSTGKIRQQVNVETVDGQPLGNLYTEGERLYSIGLRRVYCFETTPQ